MKPLYILCFLLFVSLSYAETKESEKNPVWTLKDVNGVEHHFPDSENNKTTVLFFWATWCPFCKRLMPHLQSMSYQYQDSLNLQIFALNMDDESDEDPAEVLEEGGYDFLLFNQVDKVAKHYSIKGTPGVLVFDKTGQMQFDLRELQYDQMKQNLDGNPRWQKAMKLAPYWASELRKKLESLK